MMKRILIPLIAAALVAGWPVANAAGKKNMAGPKGGRLLERTEPKAEFLVTKEHTAIITFYDSNLKPVPVSGQGATLIADAKSGKATIEFESKGDVLVSKGRLPEGDGYKVVLLFRPSADARPQNFRFVLDLHVCGGCKLAEYACTCGH